MDSNIECRPVNKILFFIPIGTIITCFIVRWILIIGYGDFGTDYDYVSRLMEGQSQGRDFFSIFPPLSGYSLLSFMKIFGHHYITVNIHLWFWWLFNIFVSAVIMLVLGGMVDKVVLVATSVALITIPPNMHGVSFAYMASGLSGLAVVFFILYFRNHGNLYGILSGIFSGIAVFVKPNVGIAIFGAIQIVCCGHAIFNRESRKSIIKISFLCLVGFTAGTIASIIIMGYNGGHVELIKEIFIGGTQIKGGVLALIIRTFPRISTNINSPYRILIETSFVFPILIGLFFTIRKLFTSYNINEQEYFKNYIHHEIKYYIWVICLAVIALSIWSLFPYQFPQSIVSLFDKLYLVSLPFLLWQLFYLITFIAIIVPIIVGIEGKEYIRGPTTPFWISIMCLVWTLGIVASGRHNSIFASTFCIPVMIFLYCKNRSEIIYKVITIILILWTISWHIAPNWRSTFGKLSQLPRGSKFSGLYWPDEAACRPGSYPLWASSTTIIEIEKNVSKTVGKKIVLWLVPGPGAAFGGTIYKFGIHGLAANNVPLWAEKKFGENVRANPPDYIISSSFDDWADNKWNFMRPEIAETWIKEQYKLVWKLKDNTTVLYLWGKK